ncbi:putative flippase GtrA [Streptomyces phaeoluteigriseus]
MTSPVLPKSQPQPAHQPLRTDGATGEGPTVAATVSTTPGPLASLIRFVVCGGGVGLLSGAAVPLLATLMPWAVANALITLTSTLVCTELHALFTFGTGRRAGWRRHLQSAGSATAAYGVTCAAVFVLYAVESSPGLVTQQVVYLGAAALAGTGRFLVLRLFVFADGTRKGTAAGARGGAGTGARVVTTAGTQDATTAATQDATTAGTRDMTTATTAGTRDVTTATTAGTRDVTTATTAGTRGVTTVGPGAQGATTAGPEGRATVPTAVLPSAFTRPVLAVAC